MTRPFSFRSSARLGGGVPSAINRFSTAVVPVQRRCFAVAVRVPPWIEVHLDCALTDSTQGAPN